MSADTPYVCVWQWSSPGVIETREPTAAELRAYLVERPALALEACDALPVAGAWERSDQTSERHGLGRRPQAWAIRHEGWRWAASKPAGRHFGDAPTREEAEAAADAVLREAGVALAGEEG